VPFELKVYIIVRSDPIVPTPDNIYTYAQLTWNDYPISGGKSYMEVFPGTPYSWNNNADIDLSAYALVATPGNAEVRVQSYTLEKQYVGYENIGSFTNQSLSTTSDVEFKSVTTSNIAVGPDAGGRAEIRADAGPGGVTYQVYGGIDNVSSGIAMLGDTRSDIQLVSNGIDEIGFASTAGQPTYSLYRDCTEDRLRINRGSDTLVQFQPSKMMLADNTTIQLGDTSSTDVGKCVSMLFVANAAIQSGRVVKIVDAGGQARVQVKAALDPDSVGVVGVTMSSTTAAGQDISVCVGGVFNACVANGATVSIGNLVEKTDIAGQDGKVWTAPAGAGSLGIALNTVTGDVGGTQFIRGVFVKNEVF
jgi:hypothetical protein